MSRKDIIKGARTAWKNSTNPAFPYAERVFNGTIIITGSLFLSGTTNITGSGGTGEVNTASNIGSGQGIFAQKNVYDLQLRSLTASGSVALVSGSDTINISSSALLSASSVGTGTPVLSGVAGTNIIINSISGSGASSVSILNGTIIVSSSATQGSGETNTASNIGSGEGIFAQKNGVDLQLRSLTASGSVALVSGSTTINISSSAIVSASVTGSGIPILSGVVGTNLHFNTITGSGAIFVSLLNGLLTLSSSANNGEANTASNIGSGQGIFAQKNGIDLQLRSLTASGSVAVVSGSDTINISSSALLSGTTTGSGIPVLASVDSTNITLRSITGSGAITTTLLDGVVNISASVNSGEANTASNLGTGQGVFAQKNGVVLELRSVSGSGFTSVVSSSTAIIVSSSANAIEPFFRTSPVYTGGSTGRTNVSNQTCAIYIGRASRNNPTITVYYAVGTGPSSITWAEVALATGLPVFGSGPSLTTRGFADISSNLGGGTFQGVSFTTTGVNVGDHIWAMIGLQATSVGTLLGGVGQPANGLFALASTTRPSTMAADTAFSTTNTAHINLAITEGP